MNIVRMVVLFFAAAIGSAGVAQAQVQITVNPDVNFKWGVLGQFQADWLEDPDADDTTQNLFIRRARLMFGGQVAKNVSFFMETDAPNLGRTLPDGKNISPRLVLQDAYGEVRLHNAVSVNVGLMFVPFSRNSVQSAGTLLALDYGNYTFTTSAATQSTIGRDVGAMARTYWFNDHLEVRLGAFQGARDENSHRAFRYTGRAQVQLLDPEPRGFFYTGTYLGARRVAAIGGAFDRQDDYSAYDVDAFVELPLGANAVTSQVSYQRIDGDTTFTTLPKQNVVLVEAGYFIRAFKLTPVFQFTNRDMLNTADGDESRWSIGLNYWWSGHNANLKGAWGRIDPRGRPEQNQFTIQFQLFYY